jgi:transposase
MKKVAESLKQMKSTILAYFRYRITNAIAEGINSLIQTAKRKASGFKTFDGFA